MIDKILTKMTLPADLTDPDPCWVWHKDASRTTTGVPRIKFKKAWHPVRRPLYEHFNGSMPESRLAIQPNIRMTCRCKDCVSPHHMRVISDFDRLVTEHERDVYTQITEVNPGTGKRQLKERWRKLAGRAAQTLKKATGKETLTKAEFKEALWGSLPDYLNPVRLAAQSVFMEKQRTGKVTRPTINQALDQLRKAGITTLTREALDAAYAVLEEESRRDGA
jgi:hypothetical protein